MVNFLSPIEGPSPSALREIYGGEPYDRLARIKRAYDPGDMFRMNRNTVVVPPSRPA